MATQGINFGFRLKDLKAGFFDRRAIASALAPTERRVLGRFGGATKQTAKRSIRNAPKKLTKRSRGVVRHGTIVSRPGDPPYSRTGLLKDHIYYAFDMSRRSVVIGPAKLSGFHGEDVPHKLEHGGTVRLPRGGTGILESRPYMRPAFDKQLQQLPRYWQEASARAAA